MARGALLEVKCAPGKETVIPAEAIALTATTFTTAHLRFRSYGEVQQWLEQECEVQAAYKTVHKLVRYKLQAKLKVPRPKSLKQHPQATLAI